MWINILQLLLWVVQLITFGVVDWFKLVPVRELAVILSVLPGVVATTLVTFEGGNKPQRAAEVAVGFLATVVSWFALGWWWWIPIALVAIWNCSQVFLVLFLNLAQVAEAVARVRAGKPAPQAPQPQAQQSTPQKGKGGFFSKFRRKG